MLRIEILRDGKVVAKGSVEKGLEVPDGVPLSLAPIELFFPTGKCDIDKFDNWLRKRLAPVNRFKNSDEYSEILNSRDKLYALIGMTKGVISHGDPFVIVFKELEENEDVLDVFRLTLPTTFKVGRKIRPVIKHSASAKRVSRPAHTRKPASTSKIASTRDIVSALGLNETQIKGNRHIRTHKTY